MTSAAGVSENQLPVVTSKWMTRVGWVLSVLSVLPMLMSAGVKLAHSPQVVGNFVGIFGYPESTLLWIGIVELSCAILYLVPQTAVLGAILVVGYLGGAIATHVRVAQFSVWPMPFALGILAWAGLYLRDARVRALLPLR